jgi:excisionase family DNA binding protein
MTFRESSITKGEPLMTTSSDTKSRLLTRSEVAEIFQVSPSTITRWAEAGKLPVVKTLGGHRRYAAKVVMDLAEQLLAAPSHSTNEIFNEEEQKNMSKAAINVPAMYGDHHVLEVRRILLALPGVEDVYASSCFQIVEVTFDPAKTSMDEITSKLDEAGYLEPLPVPVETGNAGSQEAKRNGLAFFRHTTAFEQTKNVVGFTQEVKYTSRALWPCPGIGVIKAADLEQELISSRELHPK